MGVYKTRQFDRFARKHNIPDHTLLVAARELRAGQCDADLGAGLFKQRIARSGAGKSGGYRTLVVYGCNGHAIFVHGFAKNERGNLGVKEMQSLKTLGREYGSKIPWEIKRLVALGMFVELAE